MNDFIAKKNQNNDIEFYYCDQLVGKILSTIGSEDELEEMEPGIFKITRDFYIDRIDKTHIDILRIDLHTSYISDYYTIPAVNYDGNRWGTGREPKGLESNGEAWTYSFHRSTVPGATYSEGNGVSICMFGDPISYPFSMSLSSNDNEAIHSLIYPEQEKPFVYCAKNRYETEYCSDAYILQSPFRIISYIVISPVLYHSSGLRKTLDYAWRRWSHNLSPLYSGDKLWELGMRFTKESILYETDEFSGFCMGLYWNGTRWVQNRDYLEIGWVGQNASLAVSLIYDYISNNNKDSLELGLRVLDRWECEARLENGLFRCRFEQILKHRNDQYNREEIQDAANLCGVVLNYLEAYRMLKEIGIERESYKETAIGICDFAIKVQCVDGSFAKAWYNDGSVANPDGTIGAFISWALCDAYRYTAENKYLSAAIKGFEYYYREFKQYGYTTAGALDTYCIDKESSMPLIACATQFYEFTGDSTYLTMAEEISWYLSTWQYHYTVSYPSDTILGRYEYDTLGGTTVSTQHQHIDNYALYFFKYWIKLSEYTGNQQWYERAVAIWCNATQFISDGTLVIDGNVRPAGSQDEGVCQTRWRTSRGEYFGVSRWLVCWNNAFRLEILRDPSMRKIVNEIEKSMEKTKL